MIAQTGTWVARPTLDSTRPRNGPRRWTCLALTSTLGWASWATMTKERKMEKTAKAASERPSPTQGPAPSPPLAKGRGKCTSTEPGCQRAGRDTAVGGQSCPQRRRLLCACERERGGGKGRAVGRFRSMFEHASDASSSSSRERGKGKEKEKGGRGKGGNRARARERLGMYGWGRGTEL